MSSVFSDGYYARPIVAPRTPEDYKGAFPKENIGLVLGILSGLVYFALGLYSATVAWEFYEEKTLPWRSAIAGAALATSAAFAIYYHFFQDRRI